MLLLQYHIILQLTRSSGVWGWRSNLLDDDEEYLSGLYLVAVLASSGGLACVHFSDLFRKKLGSLWSMEYLTIVPPRIRRLNWINTPVMTRGQVKCSQRCVRRFDTRSPCNEWKLPMRRWKSCQYRPVTFPKSVKEVRASLNVLD